ncbi:MAG: CsiV family protein [Saccharospirillum sp.]
MHVKRLTAASLLFIAANFALSQEDERWFKVEVLIFENPAYGVESPEVWPAFPQQDRRSPSLRIEPPETDVDVPNAAGNQSFALADLAPYPTAFAPMDDEARTLSAIAFDMRRSRGFRILYHEAWAQPVPGRDEVIPIRIDAGERFGQQYELQGYLELYVERFLHLRADLQLTRYTQTDNPFRLIDESTEEDAGAQSFSGLSLLTPESDTQRGLISDEQRYFMATESARIQELRRMRSTELHYLDNPRFGVLAVIYPQPRLDELVEEDA